ncbi:50S ribosomal protein L5 [Candidatus Daviesbacteria bacterium]|nr:50S ribosomal protein L5 [Candidatus Daviesbacteria bacterium]
MSRLKDKYLKEVLPKLMTELSLKNIWAVPRLGKVVINVGLGEAKDNQGILEKVSSYLTALSGQKPRITSAKRSIANFKLSKGQPIGLMVTLRGDKMYSFLDKLFNIVLPKLRDFRGISADSFDSSGNFTLGLKEQLIFPEVDYKTIDKIRGLAVTIVTSGKKEEGKRLLELLGMPFKKG